MLHCFSTPLNKSDSSEYKERLDRAARLAAEIEKSPDHIKNMALEDGDQDDDEKTFSAVAREANGKYIPPHLRKDSQDDQTKTWQQPHPQVSTSSQGQSTQSPTTTSPTVAQTNNGPSAAGSTTVSSPQPGMHCLVLGHNVLLTGGLFVSVYY